ncbi:MAG: hypothetical protein Kow00121_31700 [Elainellaceae cyanobacterium]
MAFWEFLLQKEGDRSWLPLESSKVEILEGRYRIVAHSDRSNVPVEIRVTHDATAEIPPMRRTQRRHSRTNKDGLVVVMPFTRLLPGIWDLRCASDVMADMLGEGWQHTVQLQVLSLEVESGDDWDLDWQGAENMEDAESMAPAAQAALQTEVAAVSSVPASIEPESKPAIPEPKILKPEVPAIVAAAETEALSEGQSGDRPMAETETLASNLLPLVPRSAAEAADTTVASTETQAAEAHSEPTKSVELAASSTASKLPQPQTKQAALREPTALQYANSGICLRLGQETYVIQRDQPLTLMGQIELLDSQLVYDLLPVGALKVRLSDPQTSRILVDERQPLTAQRVPFPFTCQITLPKHYQTYLLLGELILYGDAPEAPDQDPPILATQSFTVTTDLHELLDAIANDFAQSDLPAPKGSSASPQETGAQNVVFLNPTKIPAQVQFRPSSQRPLPPQLHPPDPAKLPRSPQLPAFSQTAANAYQPKDPQDTLSTVESADKTVEVVAGSEFPIADEPIADEPVADEPVADEPVADELITEVAAPSATTRETELQEVDTEIAEIIANAAETPQAASKQPQATDTETAGLSPFTAPQLIDDAPIPGWDRQEHSPQQQRSPDTTDRTPESPEDAAFRSLNLQERFWTRLQTLVSERELFGWEDLMPADADSWTEAGQSSSAQMARVGQQGQPALGLDADLVSQEVMAEDELYSVPEPTADEPPLSTTQERSVLVLPDEEPIPVPQLEIRPNEPVAGDTLEILVRLPDLPTRLFVKLWLRDRQNRSILDGPQWLMGFLPDGFGRLTARTTSTVPQGCLEVQIEAIAVEIASSRESDKASLTRQVVLPDLPSLSLDELDM